jgi:hypothetical protein
VLTALAASGHLAYDAVSFVSLLSPCRSALAGGPEEIISPGPEPALGGPVCVLWNAHNTSRPITVGV